MAHPGFAQEPAGTSTITLGIGGNFPTVAYGASGSYSNAPTVLGGYEYRIEKYLAADLGIENAFPAFSIPGLHGAVATPRVHTLFTPFGLRGILPLDHERAEVYAGFGGAYVWHGGYQPNPAFGFPASINEWMWQPNAGARLAIDRGHRYWLGCTVRYYRAGLGSFSQQYLSFTGDVSFRFR